MQNSESLTSSQEPKSRKRIILSLGIISFAAIPIGILDIHFMLSDIQTWRLATLLIVILSPIVGRSAWLMANTELKRIQDGIIPPSSLRVSKLGRSLAVWGTFGGPLLFALILAVSSLL